jgi:hypothetical protein
MRASRLMLPTIVWVLAATLGACGHHGGSGTPSPTPSSIALTSSGPRLFLGTSETFVATVMFSDGSTAAATGATWSTDSPATATVDATGKVLGKASGMVTVIVDAMGLHGTKLIRVLPNYGGNWGGTYGIGNCSATGTFFLTCTDFDDFFPHPITLTLSQTGDAVSGTAVLGFVTGPMTGTVGADGTLNFTVNGLAATPGTKTFTLNWHLTSTADGAASGTLTGTGADTASAASHLTFDSLLSNITRR